MKVCGRCKSEKDHGEFGRDSRRDDGLKTYCDDCRREKDRERWPRVKDAINATRRQDPARSREISRKWRASNREKLLGLKREWYRENVEYHLFSSARGRASRAGVPFDLERSDIVIPSHCPILGVPLKLATGKAAGDSPSLDRIVPRLGYVKGNVHVISFRANTIKSDATPGELRAVAEYIERLASP